jgi:hypothetical protein
MKKTIGGNVSNDKVSFGNFMSWVVLILGGLIGISLIIFGVWLVLREHKHTETTSAFIREADCKTPFIGSDNKWYKCALKLEYNVNGKKYEKTYNTTDYKYNVNTSLTIHYNPKEPDEIVIRTVSGKVSGLVCCLFGILLTLLSVLFFYTRNRGLNSSLNH